jgi:predicted TIM-barrel fold metal-dependent hydrolase
MIDDIFILDNVCHVYDLSDENVREDEPTALYARDQMAAAFAGTRLPENQHYPVKVRFTAEDIYQMVFVDGGIDMTMVQAVPIFEWYHDWFAPIRAQYEMAQRYPDRVIFCGGVDPLFNGLDGALDGIRQQTEEMGARSFKFYNGHVNGGWRCDDPELAYPMYELLQELGVTTLQFHKGIPFGQQDLEPLHPGDLQKAARDFPDLNFLIHHLADPFVDEAINIAGRFPNVYLVGSGVFNLSVFQPRKVQTWIGRLLYEVGVDKVIWGSEVPLQGNPRPYLKDFMRLQVPEDLQEGWGYPEVTKEDKRKILGLNFARLLGIDLAAEQRKLYGSETTR